MKRIGNIYDQICDINNIYAAMEMAAKGKKYQRRIRHYLENREKYALKIRDMLLEENYRFGETKHLTITEGACNKTRDITVPKFFPDQIIHWCLMLRLSPVLKKGMYRYCCGSVPQRGGMAAKKYLEKVIRKDLKIKYVMDLDVRKFFQSVNNDKLKELFRRKIKDKRALHLIDAIIDHGGQGLPIGFYTSQWFSNFYLEAFDHYIKEQLHIKYYVRYVDDMELLDTNKRKLHKARLAIGQFFDEQNYGLKIKDNWQVFRFSEKANRPIDFVGFRFYKDKTLLRKHIFYRLNRNIRRIAKTNHATPKQARSTLSLLGWLTHINGKGFYLKHIKPVISKSTLKHIVSQDDKRRQIKLNGKKVSV